MRKPFPGYESSIMAKLKTDSEEVCKARHEHFEATHRFEFTDVFRVEEYMIPVKSEGVERRIRIVAPADLPAGAPIILDIHGGAWMVDGIDGDNYRAAMLAMAVPAVVAMIDYRGSKPDGSLHFPETFLDVVAGYEWLIAHGDEIGGDSSRIGIHGSSSGANMAAGLAHYIRDNGLQQPCLNILNCPCVSTHILETASYWQHQDLHPGNAASTLIPESVYVGGFGSGHMNAYAFASEALSFEKLCPHFVITAEYDTLRDDGLKYAFRLLSAGVPTEVYSAPRVGHCFTAIPHPFTEQINELMATSFRREFGMLDEKRKR